MSTTTESPESPPSTTTVSIRLNRDANAPAHGCAEPFAVGVPFARGAVHEISRLELEDPDGIRISMRRRVLECWPDGSVRWLLIGFLVGTESSHAEVVLRVKEAFESSEDTKRLTGSTPTTFDAGPVVFDSTETCAGPFDEARLTSAVEPLTRLSQVQIEDADGTIWVAQIDESTTNLDAVEGAQFRTRGRFHARAGKPVASFTAQTTIVPGTGLARFDVTVTNDRPARHKGGTWDLGDVGSILFRELRLVLLLDDVGETEVEWRSRPEDSFSSIEGDELSIYQDSSGGENWNSRNHVNRDGDIPVDFRGCRVRAGESEETIERALPTIRLTRPAGRLTATIPNFWQEFPKSIRWSDAKLELGLLAGEHSDLHELQGGERKTFTVWFLIDSPEEPSELGDLSWVHHPIVPSLSTEHHANAATFDYFVDTESDPHCDYVELMQNAVDGPHSFFAKRESIDEYGWRHFGDTPADHENRFYDGPKPVISHYNNQYDLAYGLLLHFARTGDRRWFELARDLVAHVVDIDRYHTTSDRPNFNGGYFWHTDHYTDAGRSTHRTYTQDCPAAKSGQPYGGGPSNEHNYTSGLLQFFLMTGDLEAARAVTDLADWVIAMDDGPSSILSPIDDGPTGFASCTFTEEFQGPGRGAGHSINTLLDAHRLSSEGRYLAKAEELIRRCIHPNDDLDALNLLDPESRWSYAIFLQILGKYLDRKVERGERDDRFEYARASLLHYARWMLEHECSFRSRFEKVEFPTETWAAQDMRKSCVLDFAAKYGPEDLREDFSRRAEEFFRESLVGVESFDTKACTRPLAILLTSGAQRAAFVNAPPEPIAPPTEELDFGEPSGFVSQRVRVKQIIKSPKLFGALIRLVLSPRKALRIVKAFLR